MTDLDVVCRRAAPGWLPVAGALRDVIGPDQCGRAIEVALAKYLREHGGLSDPLVAEYLRLRCDGHEPVVDDLAHVLRALVRHQVAERVLPGLVAAGVYHSRTSAEAHFERCLLHSKIDVLAERWRARPDGRVNASRRRRSALDALLLEPAPLGSSA